MTGAMWKQAATEYKQLSEEDQEMYRELGRRGTEAWRAGFRSFATAQPQTSPETCPGVLAPGSDPSMEDAHVMAPVVGQQLVLPGQNFEADLSRIRSLMRAAAARRAAQKREQLEELVASEKKTLQEQSTQIAVFTETSPEATFRSARADSRSGLTQLDWWPPCAEMAEA